MTQGATTGRQSSIYRENVRDAISDAVFRNSEFLPMFRVEQSGGNTTHSIPVIVAANDSAQVYTEDQLTPDAGYQQTIKAAADFKHIRVFARVTGHARRGEWAVRGSEAAPGLYGGMRVEHRKAMEDLVDLTNTTFLANATYGLVGIVDDDTTNYYDQSRSTYTALKSYVKTASAALSAALLDRLIMETYNAPYGGRIQLMLMAPAQARKYSAIVHGKLAPLAATDVAGFSAVNALPPYGSVQAAVVRDLSATVIVGMSGMDTSWYYLNHEPAPGGIDIKAMDSGSDADLEQISTAGALICTQPNQQGKLETLGTT
jgi:hypothetical protein